MRMETLGETCCLLPTDSLQINIDKLERMKILVPPGILSLSCPRGNFEEARVERMSLQVSLL